MNRSVKITIELSDDLCEWVESLIFSEEIPVAVESEEETEEEEEVEKVAPPKLRSRGNFRYEDPDNPLGTSVHETFLKLHHLSKRKLKARCEEFLDIKLVDGTKTDMVDQILTHIYGADADKYLSTNFEKFADIVGLAIELIQASGRAMTVGEVRDELLKDFIFNPQHIYDGLSRATQNGHLEREGDGYKYAPRPDREYHRLSSLAKEAISHCTEKESLEGIAQIVIEDLEMKYTTQNVTRLTAVMMHILTSGIFTPMLDVDSDFLGDADVDQGELRKRCSKWLEEMKV